MRIYAITGLILPVLTLAMNVYSPASAAFWVQTDGNRSCVTVCQINKAQAVHLPVFNTLSTAPAAVCAAKGLFSDIAGFVITILPAPTQGPKLGCSVAGVIDFSKTIRSKNPTDFKCLCD